MSQENDTTQTVKRKHLTEAERKTIERMKRAGANNGEIARALYRDKSTIKREIKRGNRNKIGECAELVAFVEMKILGSEKW